MFFYRAFFLLLCVIALITYKKIANNRQYRLPPGPKGLPLIGNGHQLPKWKGCKQLRLWAQTYGEMYTVRLGTQTWVYLNSSRVIKSLLEKHSAVSSSRPRLPMASEIMSDGKRITLMQYGPPWRAMRKAIHPLLTIKTAESYGPLQEEATHRLLKDYLKHPEDWHLHHGTFSNSIAMSIAYGQDALSKEELKAFLDQMETVITAMQPGANLVDVFPELTILPKPLQWWRPKGFQYLAATERAYSLAWNRMKESIKAGGDGGFGKIIFENMGVNGFDEHTAMFIASQIVEGGSDTTRGTITIFIAACVSHPDFVVRLREQLDAVCGVEGQPMRLPSFDDYKHLPLVQASVKELLRWRPLADLGMPHLLTEDIVFEDYHLPKGTILSWNAWAISQDPNEYPEPDRFYPERFLDSDLDDVQKGIWAFGAGRRLCPGLWIANRSLWIVIASLVYCFDFHYAGPHKLDDQNTEFIFTKGKEPFPLSVAPRSQAHAALILEAAA